MKMKKRKGIVMQIKKNVILPVVLIMLLLLAACGSKIPEPAEGYDLVLVTDSPDSGVDAEQTNTDTANNREPSSVKASDLYSGYGFCHQLCAESGYYRFTAVNSQGVVWQVYVLDQEFTDAERYIPHAYDIVLEGSGVVHIDSGKWIYVYCPCNEWTGSKAPDGCAFSWVMDPNATAADVSATPVAESGSSADPEPVSTPAPTPAPTPTPAPKALSITKHPTAETVQQGGTCWFIARADNADSITWEFLDATGAVCSVENAKTRNPGLTVEIYDNGETVGLKNIPMSMNGWQARARFDSKTSTTSLFSNPALITVTAITDFKTAYSSVFENYISLAGGGEDKYELGTDLALSGITLGYFLKDLDGDGSEELIVGQIGGTTGSLWDHVVYSVFTLNNGTPVMVLKSNARDRYYFNGTGFIHEGSSGADSSDIYSCKYSNGTLSIINGVYTTAEGFFYVENGDRSSGTGTQISSDQFNACVVSYEGSIKAMMLTPIA